MISRHILFRADATIETGGGHIYRCATLSRWFSNHGWKTTLATVADTASIIPKLSDSFDSVRVLSAMSLMEARTIGDTTADIAVIDHYQLDHHFEAACRSIATVVAVIDDLACRSHECDLILNQNAGSHYTDYAFLGVKPVRRVLAGAEYALLRPSFAQTRSNSLARNRTRLRDAVIAMGATDSDGLTLDAVSALKTIPLNSIEIVIGSACPHLDAIKALASSDNSITVHVDADPAQLYAKSDIAVGTAGVGALERCCMGVPSLTLVAAENQRRAAAYLHDAGASISVTGNAKARYNEMAGLLAALSNTPEKLGSMSERAAQVCDGQGTARVGEALIALVEDAPS